MTKFTIDTELEGEEEGGSNEVYLLIQNLRRGGREE